MSTAAPIWILAAPFSGASWLAGCLGCHPQLYAVPELNLFMASAVGELLDIFDLGQSTHSHGLLRTLAELEFGGQSERTIAQAREWLEQRRDWPTGEVAAYLAARVAPRRLVVPDSESPLRPMDLRRLRMQLPDAQWVHLVRHPWEQGCLLTAWARERLFVPPDFKDHAFHPPQIDAQIPWLRANANIQQLLAHVMDSNWLRLRSEDVEQATDATLLSLSDGLMLSTDAAALEAMRYPEHWTFAAVGPATAPGGLEAEMWEPYSDQTLALAAGTALTRPLPWRGDGEPFALPVVAIARQYGYS